MQSFGTADRVYGHVWGSTTMMFAWQEGRFATVTSDCEGPSMPWRWDSINYPVNHDRSCLLGALHTYPTHGGFGWIAREMDVAPLRIERLVRLGRETFRATGPIVPFWSLVILTAAVSVVPLIGSRPGLRSLVMTTALAAKVLGVLLEVARK
jgi:hypothetical protein